MTESIWLWVGFNLFVLAMLALDLGVFHRKTHVVTFKESITWTVVWVAMAMVFNRFPRMLRDLATKQVADDQPALATAAATAGAKPDGVDLFKVGEGYAGYGQFDKGIELMQAALPKGGFKSIDEARLHLGEWLLKAGKKALSQEQTQLKASLLAVLDVVRDESNKDAPVRLVFEPKTSRIEQSELINSLLAHTSLESSS
ncbi:MAG: hypothetical protein WCP53_08840, partial [Verrucomicrobiota bacterium]